MKPISVIRGLAVGGAALVLAGCGAVAAKSSAPSAPSAPSRGDVVSVTPLEQLDVPAVGARLRELGIDGGRVTHGVRSFRVEYHTVDPNGAPTTASSVVAVPDATSGGQLRLVSWQHGTTAYKPHVASVSAGRIDRTAVYFFAAAGYAVSAPDYLGLGTGPGTHPYNHHDSTVTASIDALRAARSVPGVVDRELDSRVLISGFSQGGPATMALGNALHGGAEPAFQVGALAPIAGPFNFTGSVAAAASGGIAHATTYLGYLTVAWNRLHHLYDDPAEAFRPPYHRTVEALFDGTHPFEEIEPNLPATPAELFTPAFLDQLQHPAGALRNALKEADATCDWAPTVPVRIYHAAGDLDVPVANAEVCRRSLTERGATAEVVQLGDMEHLESMSVALPLVLDQFAAS
jgi:dienelactone hydrolase